MADGSSLGTNFDVAGTILTIKENVIFAENVIIRGGGHKFMRTDIPIKEQGNFPITSLVIDSDVWVGTNVIILGKVSKIGKGAVIGAGSVVTKDVPEYAIVAGNPAIVRRYRK